MKQFIGVIAVIFLSISACAENIILKNVTVLTMSDNTALTNATVIVSGDRILYAGPQDKAPDFQQADQIIDATGKFLVPGLAEMHGHLPSSGVNTQQTKDTLFLYLAGGVTTVRGMLGNPVQFEMQKEIQAGTLAGPVLYLAAPSLNGNTVTSPEDGITKVKKYHAAGYDLLKIHPGLTRAEYDAIAETAKALGMPFGGHVPADVGLERALKSKQISLDHMDGFIIWMGGNTRIWTAQDLRRAVEVTKASGTWIVPTQALFNTFYSGDGSDSRLSEAAVASFMARPENAYVPKSQLRRWQRIARSARPNPIAVQNRQTLLKAFADGGANLVMGTDAPQTFSVPGFSIWREIETMVEAGLNPEQILKISAGAAGRYFKDKDKFGKIAVGMRADLLLLGADPRLDAKNLSKQSGVIAAGRWYSREAIEKRLATIAKRHQ